MPLYKYACHACGIDSLIIRPLGTDMANCRVCGETIGRVSAFGTAFVVEPAPVPEDQKRHDLRLWREASEERDYYHRREEDRAQRELPSPNLWKQAQRRANLVNAGKAPPPRTTR